MCRKLDIHKFGTKDNPVPQSERISPASMRAWFITQRLYSDSNVKIELLARVTGTSISQIEARYLRLDMDRSYEYLSVGGWNNQDLEPVYVDGYYAGHKRDWLPLAKKKRKQKQKREPLHITISIDLPEDEPQYSAIDVFAYKFLETLSYWILGAIVVFAIGSCSTLLL